MSSFTEEANAAANAALKEKTGMTPAENRALEAAGLGQYGAAGLPLLKQMEANKAAPNAQCANGGPGAPGGPASGAAGTGGVNPKLMSNYNCALGKWQAANPGSPVQWNIISGVRNSSTVANSQHFTGDAIDLQASVNGKAFTNVGRGTVGTDSYQLYKSMAAAMNECDSNMNWGGNFENGVPYDLMHFGYGQKSTVNGNLFQGKIDPKDPVKEISSTYKGSNDPSVANANLTGDNASAAQQAATQNAGAANPASAPNAGNAASCGSGGGGGCAPVSAMAAPIAASLAAGAGLASPIASAVNALASGTGLGPLQQGLQNAIGGSMGGLSNLTGAIGNAASLAGMTNPASMLSGAMGNALQQIGNFSQVGGMLTGVMGSLGNAQGMVGSMLGHIQGTIGNVFGSLGNLGNLGNLANLGSIGNITGMLGSVPQLGNFAGMMGNMLSAGGLAGNIQGLMQTAGGQLFGNVSGLAGNLAGMAGFNLGNMANTMFGGYPSQILNDLGAADLDMLAGGFLQGQFRNAMSGQIDLTGNFNEVMQQLTSGSKFNAFTSIHSDYNSLVTNGFGTLTASIPNLAKDLMNLGRLGDLNDVMNIGTSGQVARLLVENGLGAATGISMMMQEKGLNSRAFFQDEYHNDFYNILSSISDPDTISMVKEKMLISDYLDITHLGDLVDHAKMFPYSYDDNDFDEIRDMAPLLSIIGTCRSNTFEDLGRVLYRLEDLSNATDLLNETNLIRPEELINLKMQLPPAGYFNPSMISIADFIGSAAGYVHQNTLPRIKEIHDSLENDYDIIDDFKALMTLLTDTLNGEYLVPGTPDTIVVPTTAGYVFGTYLNLDDAAADIKDAIEEEIGLIETAIDADPDLKDLFNEFTNHWNESHDYLVHEKKMRKAFGIDFGPSNHSEYFAGDGSTLSFPLQLKVQEGMNVSVFINGVKQFGNAYSYDPTTNSIVMTSAPGVKSVINVEYPTGLLQPSGGINEIWNFATNLEQFALQTGYGMPADFLNRIVTDDMHGQRIKAAMVQARNEHKLRSNGCFPLGLSTVTDDVPEQEMDYVNHTGIWSSNPSRAAEIFLQHKTEKDDPYKYMLDRISTNKSMIDADVDSLLQNVMRQLIFFYDGNLVMSQLFADIYNNEDERSIKDIVERPDLIIQRSDDLPTDGYILGPYVEIMSKLMEIENLKNTTFVQRISADTEKYHQGLGVDMSQVVRLLQRVLAVNGSSAIGVNEGDFTNLFGAKSVSKMILQNIAYDY